VGTVGALLELRADVQGHLESACRPGSWPSLTVLLVAVVLTVPGQKTSELGDQGSTRAPPRRRDMRSRARTAAVGRIPAMSRHSHAWGARVPSARCTTMLA